MAQGIKILNPPSLEHWSYSTPPLGIAILQQNLKRAGFDVEIDDLETKFLKLSKPLPDTINGWLVRRNFAQISSYAKTALSTTRINQKDVGISVFCKGQLFPALVISEYLTSLGKRVYLGGRLAPFLKHSAIRKKVSINNRIFETQNEFIKFLGVSEPESTNLPDFSGLPLKLYKTKIRGNRELILPYLIKEGCNKVCAFCNEFAYPKPPLSKPRKSVAREIGLGIKKLKQIHKTRYFFFADCAVNNDPELLGLVAEELVDAGIEWGGFACVPGLQPSLLRKMKRSGCRYLLLGIESGSQRILKLMSKAQTTRMAEIVIRNVKGAGIFNHCFFMTNFPGETKEDHLLTRGFLRRNSQYMDDAFVQIFELDEGSYIIQHPRQFGIKVSPKASFLRREYSMGNMSYNQVLGVGKNRKLELELLIAKNVKLRRYLRHPIAAMKSLFYSRFVQHGFPLDRLFDYT